MPQHSQIQSSYTYQPTKREQTECSKMLAYKIQTLGNYPEENIQIFFFPAYESIFQKKNVPACPLAL